MRRSLILPLALLLAVIGADPAADLMYSFTGNFFDQVSGAYTTSDRVTGFFVFKDQGFDHDWGVGANPITSAVTSWSFTDGHQTLI